MSVGAVAHLSFGQFLVVLVLDAALAMWVYWHASRHGSRHATAWGVATFFVWLFLLVYLVHYHVTRRRF